MNSERDRIRDLLATRPLLLIVLLAVVLAGCGKQKEEKEQPKEAKEEKAPESESHVKHGTNGEVIVTIEEKIQKTIGLETKTVEPVQLAPEIKAYGRVMDASPLAQVIADLVGAEAAAQTSQNELKRLKTLQTQANTSERA